MASQFADHLIRAGRVCQSVKPPFESPLGNRGQTPEGHATDDPNTNNLSHFRVDQFVVAARQLAPPREEVVQPLLQANLLGGPF